MATLTAARMSVDEYLVWAEGRPGRYELHDGVVVAMSPEGLRHANVNLQCKPPSLQLGGRAGFLAAWCPTA